MASNCNITTSFRIAFVPEPATLALMGIGLIGLRYKDEGGQAESLPPLGLSDAEEELIA